MLREIKPSKVADKEEGKLGERGAEVLIELRSISLEIVQELFRLNKFVIRNPYLELDVSLYACMHAVRLVLNFD
jgi:hypothetical protein